MSSLRIATRNSPLALWQANFVKQKLQQAHPELEVEIMGMTTQGDQLLDRSLSTVGGKGLFLKELEVSLLNNETDIAVHSMKDVPVSLPQGLEISVFCERADARDAFVSNDYENLSELPAGAQVGTSSLRRIAQLKSAFPLLQFVELRGNVNTRLAKLDDGEYDAIILAAAGLIRLDFADRIKQYITPEICLPAVGQGIVGIECRIDDTRTKGLLEPLHNSESALFLAAERAMNEVLQGGCQVPVAGYAEVENDHLRMRGMVGRVDGSGALSSNMVSADLDKSNARKLGENVAEDLLKQGAGDILSDLASDSVSNVETDRSAVVLTRQSGFLGNMEALLETLDFQPVLIPILQVGPVFDDALPELFKNLDQFTDIVFVSRNAVEMGMSKIEQQQSKIHATTRVMAVGAESAKQLYKLGIDSLFPNHGSGADALLSVSQLADLSGRNILIIRGYGGLNWPAEEMRNRGAQVQHADVYTQTMPLQAQDQMNSLLEEHDTIAGVFIHSAQSAINFISLCRDDIDRFSNTVLIAGSERIGAAARNLGWKSEIRVAQSPSNKHMMISFTGGLTGK